MNAPRDAGRSVAWDDDFDNSYRMIGAAHAVSNERAAQSRIDALREVVSEVTRGRIAPPPRRSPRF